MTDHPFNHARDIMHAIALEREAIAAWLDQYSDGTDSDPYHQLAEHIRAGEHNREHQ